MSNQSGQGQARPDEVLRNQLMDKGNPKSELEHFAAREIRRLVLALRDVVNGNDLAIARKQPMDSWSDSDFRRVAKERLEEDRGIV